MSETPQAEKCAECAKPIGRMESPYLYNEKTVCADCYQRLAGVSGDVSSADTVVLPKSHESILRKNDTLPFAVLSNWRPDHPAYKRLQQRERHRHKLRILATMGGIAAIGGMLAALIGGGAGYHALLAAGLATMLIGLLITLIALW